MDSSESAEQITKINVYGPFDDRAVLNQTRLPKGLQILQSHHQFLLRPNILKLLRIQNMRHYDRRTLFRRCILFWFAIPITYCLLHYFVLNNTPSGQFNALSYRLEFSEPLDLVPLKPNILPNKNRTFLGTEVTDIVFKDPGHSLRAFERNGYITIPDYVKASRHFKRNESVTYTTHGEYSYLDNLVPIVERWDGPVSVAVYSPGSDFQEAVTRIRYLRECTSLQMKALVTFHIVIATQYLNETNIAPFDNQTGTGLMLFRILWKLLLNAVYSVLQDQHTIV